MKKIDDWFSKAGVYIVYDGQFGSTGKGLLAGYLVERHGKKITAHTTNIGPNSGHTAYHGYRKIVTKQLPIGAVVNNLQGNKRPTFINGGAAVDMERLLLEADEYDMERVFVHPNAAVVVPGEEKGYAAISSTMQGVGSAFKRRIDRSPTKMGVVGNFVPRNSPADKNRRRPPRVLPWHDGVFSRWDHERVLYEIGQGWGLGIISGRYPFVTSRQCSPGQAMADLDLPLRSFQKSIVSLRINPIRTGNVEGGWSGPGWTETHKELSWSDLGVEPEISTVTKRLRRVFEWNDDLFTDMLRATAPDALFINFCNYHPDTWETQVGYIVRLYVRVLGRDPDFVLTGHGPRSTDIREWKND